jgi:hypothetical protein
VKRSGLRRRTTPRSCALERPRRARSDSDPGRPLAPLRDHPLGARARLGLVGRRYRGHPASCRGARTGTVSRHLRDSALGTLLSLGLRCGLAPDRRAGPTTRPSPRSADVEAAVRRLWPGERSSRRRAGAGYRGASAAIGVLAGSGRSGHGITSGSAGGIPSSLSNKAGALPTKPR